MKARLHLGKRLRQMLAFLMIGIIVSGRFCAGLTAVYASDQSEDALFSIDGLNLLNAFGDAEDSEEVFDYASLALKAENSSVEERYEELLGQVYLLDKDILKISNDSAPGGTALDVFYDSEEGRVIFLYENKSELTVTFNTNVAGYRTNPVIVKPNTDRLDEENAARGVNYADEDEEDSEDAKRGAFPV
jgi:hypothetical protein